MMSKQLIESIIDDNLIEAKDIFAERMEEILECKLYEAKRMIQAELNEAKPGGGLTTPEIEARKKAGYRPASEVLGKTETEKSPAAKRLAAQSKGKGDDDLKAKLMQARSEWKKAPFGERKKAVQMVQKAAKEYAARQAAPKKTSVTPTETPTQTKVEPQAAPQADTTTQKPEKIKRPDWASLSAKTIQNVKDKRRQEKIQSWNKAGKDAAQQGDVETTQRMNQRAKKLKGAIEGSKFKKTLGTTLRAIGSGFRHIAATAGE